MMACDSSGNAVWLNNMTEAICAYKGMGGCQAGTFSDGMHWVHLADGTYSLYAYGDAYFYNNVCAPSAMILGCMVCACYCVYASCDICANGIVCACGGYCTYGGIS